MSWLTRVALVARLECAVDSLGQAVGLPRVDQAADQQAAAAQDRRPKQSGRQLVGRDLRDAGAVREPVEGRRRVLEVGRGPAGELQTGSMAKLHEATLDLRIAGRPVLLAEGVDPLEDLLEGAKRVVRLGTEALPAPRILHGGRGFPLLPRPEDHRIVAVDVDGGGMAGNVALSEPDNA